MAKDQQQQKELEWLVRQIAQAQDNKWYGRFGVVFQAGKVSVLEKQETIKPPMPDKKD